MEQSENLKNGVATQFKSGGIAAENGRKGGIASGEAKRKRKTLRELAELIGQKTVDMPMPNGTTEKMQYDAAMIQRQYQKAILEGDTQAAKFLANLLGEEQLAAQQVTIYNVPQQTADGMQRLEQTDI